MCSKDDPSASTKILNKQEEIAWIVRTSSVDWTICKASIALTVATNIN